jgi:6-phospho-3-hexuloisomerase
MSFADLVERACTELRGAAGGVDPVALAALVDELVWARRIVVYGVGREGLMMRALAMRLYHLGLDAHVVGEMSCPPVGEGDLLIVSAGPGDFSTVRGLIEVAWTAGAKTACVTAQPKAPVPAASDLVLVIPAQTMADDQGEGARSVLPMGSLFEGAEYVVFELLVLMLRDKIHAKPAAMRARHTNLE